MRTNKYLAIFLILFATVQLLPFFMSSSSFAATDYPRKPIKFISSWPGGAGGDQEIRNFALYLRKYLPVPMVIENVPGAGGKIGMTKAAKSEPDGYTLIYITPPLQMTNEYLSKTDYVTKEFVPVYSYFKRTTLLLVNSESSWKTIEEFVKAAKERPLAIGLSGTGSATHLNALGVMKAWGVNFNNVFYETGSQAITQLAGKHIDVVIGMGTTVLPLVRAGKVKALLRFSETPVEGYENVPGPSDKGYKISYIYGLGGIIAPPKTPANVIKILEQACDKTSRDPEFLDWAAKGKYEVIHSPSEEFRKRILEQYAIIEDSMPAIRALEKK
ncbi:MAG: Bug family tripartite tricarboxylate transporter substrate binding protein [Thermodesulfobacteriota bacterium]